MLVFNWFVQFVE